MIQIKSYLDGIHALEENNILIYKPYNHRVVFLVRKSEDKITAFNFNMRYSISYADFNLLLNEFNIFVYEPDNDVEIDEEFHALRQ
jgi:hypothetical protein